MNLSTPTFTTSTPTTPPNGGAPHPLAMSTRRALALAVVGAPLLIAVNSVFHPEVDMTGAGFLAGAEAGAARWFAVHVVAAIGALLGAPAAVGLRTLVRHRGRRLATSGMALTLIAAPILALGFASEASVLRFAATELDPAAALVLAEAFTSAPEFYAIGIGVMVGTLGSLLLGLGLLTSRSVPPALPAIYLLATAATAAGAPGTALGPIAFGVVAVVSTALAVRIARPVPTGVPSADDAA
jgi:hypothetical protein